MTYNFDYYRIFYSVAKHQNMTTAVNDLYLSQPTISRRIQKLESELGCALFIRSKKGMALTPEGELLYQHLDTMFQELEETENRLKQIKDLKNGSIHITATEMTMQFFLLPYLEQFKADYPGIQVKLSLSYPETIMTQLNSGDIDFSIFTTPLEVDKSVQLTPLARCDDILVCGKAYEHLTTRPFHLAELEKELFILMRSGTTARSFIDQHFHSHKVSISPAYEVSTMPVIGAMAEANMGIGVTSPFYVQEQLQKGTLFQIELVEQLPQREICLCTSNVYPQSAASKEFIRRLLASAQKK